MDLESGTEFVVSALPGGQYCPMIVENRVYFIMRDRRGVMSLFEKKL